MLCHSVLLSWFFFGDVCFMAGILIMCAMVTCVCVEFTYTGYQSARNEDTINETHIVAKTEHK
jgi:hypothetical protein